MGRADLPGPLRLGVATWLAWAGGMFANVTQEETFMGRAAGLGLCASAITMVLALGGPLAPEEGKIQEADLNPNQSLGADPNTQREQEESVILNH